jgi:hypothetical protein
MKTFDLTVGLNMTALDSRPQLVDIDSFDFLECLNCELAIRREQWNTESGPMHLLVEDIVSDWIPTKGNCYSLEAESLSSSI